MHITTLGVYGQNDFMIHEWEKEHGKVLGSILMVLTL